ncbi:MAG: polyprenyl synthetase family protein [Coprococcus sp.]
MLIEDEIKLHAKEAEEIIYKYLPKEEGFQKTVIEAMNYSMTAGGKRLRPVLMLETYRLFGGSSNVIEPFMAAIEMIHTYSLIHDDLPALDNDEYRRGRKTSHVVYGEAMAILAGDGLLNYAFETACKSFDMTDDICKVAEALKVLVSKPGIYGMIGGQVLDVQMTGQAMDEEQLYFVYENKTGALIEAAMMIGAILAGASAEDINAVCRIASDVGHAFQIQDDLLDILGDSTVIGKPILSDEDNGKVTYVTVHGIEKAQKDVRILSERAVSRLTELKYKNEFLKALIISLVTRKK